eukprot:Awhi_evm1s14089
MLDPRLSQLATLTPPQTTKDLLLNQSNSSQHANTNSKSFTRKTKKTKAKELTTEEQAEKEKKKNEEKRMKMVELLPQFIESQVSL